jgi:hypothetical protein
VGPFFIGDTMKDLFEFVLYLAGGVLFGAFLILLAAVSGRL